MLPGVLLKRSWHQQAYEVLACAACSQVQGSMAGVIGSALRGDVWLGRSLNRCLIFGAEAFQSCFIFNAYISSNCTYLCPTLMTGRAQGRGGVWHRQGLLRA